MGKAVVRLVVLLLCSVVFAQSYRPVEIGPSVSGSHRYLTPEDLWRVALRGVIVQRSLLFRLEVYLYDALSGELLYRGSSFALKQSESIWEVDFDVLSGFGAIRQEGVSVQWWASVQQNGGYLPSGKYRVEYVAVETDEECLWTGIELARQEAYFEVVSDYVIEPVFPVNGDTVCGTVQFIWEVVGVGSLPYTLQLYYGRLSWGDIVGVRPLVVFGNINQNQYSGMGSVIINQEGWYTYVVKGGDGVLSKPIWFYFRPECSEGDDGSDNMGIVPAGWWHQLDYTQGVQAIGSRGDTIYLEWLQSCVEQARFALEGKNDLTIVSYAVSGPWHRIIALVPEGEKFKVEIEVCGTKTQQEWKIIKGK